MRFSAPLAMVLLSAVLVFGAMGQEGDFPVLKGSYLGYEPPRMTPVSFPFDFSQDGYRLHSAPVFTPDNKKVYFSAMDFSVQFSEGIFVMEMAQAIWKPPEVAPFSGGLFDGSPSMSRDGEYLFFLKLISVPWEPEVYWVSAGALDIENFHMNRIVHRCPAHPAHQH